MLPTGQQQRRIGLGLAAILLASAAASFGCGGSSPRAYPKAVYLGTTHAVLLASTVGGNEPVTLDLGITSLMLKNQDGKTVTVFNGPNCASNFAACLGAEFMHVNGRVSAPLLTAEIPDGIYTSATVSVGECGADLVGATSSFFGFCNLATGSGAATVSLPTPLSILGPDLALNLQLDLDPSIQTMAGCFTASSSASSCDFTLVPAFTLTTIPIAQPPTSIQNGLITGINGQIETIASGGLQLLTGEGAKLTLATNSDTQIQGLAALADLAPNMYVQADAALQPDGSLLATRIEVDDPKSLYWTTGTLVTGLDALSPQFEMYDAQTMGAPLLHGIGGYSITAGTAFKTDAAFSNLSSLPFPAIFNAQTMVGGQSVSLFYSQLQGPSNYSSYPPVTTITLQPQAFSGTVSAVSQTGPFTVYETTLAADSLFSAIQPITGPWLHPADPSVIYAYAGPSTLAPPNALAVGTTAVFRGLIFDDNGTLRMDCERVIPVG